MFKNIIIVLTILTGGVDNIYIFQLCIDNTSVIAVSNDGVYLSIFSETTTEISNK